MQKGEMGFSRLLGMLAVLFSGLMAAWSTLQKSTPIEDWIPDKKQRKKLMKKFKKAQKKGLMKTARKEGGKLVAGVYPVVAEGTSKLVTTVEDSLSGVPGAVTDLARSEGAKGVAETVRTGVVEPVSEFVAGVPSAVNVGTEKLKETGAGLLGAAAGGTTAVAGTAGAIGAAASKMPGKAGKAVKAGAGEVGSATGNFFGLLFWLAVLALLIVFVFNPDKELRSRVWQFVKETSLSLIQIAIASLKR